MPQSGGIYDLEENDWIKKPNADDIKSIGLNKFSIKDKAANIMTIIDDMYDKLSMTDDLHEIEQIGDESILEKNIPVFKILFNSNKNDMIYINMKKFLNEDNIVRFLFKKEIGFGDFLLHLQKCKNNGFQFLINFLLHTKDKRNEIIFDDIFDYFN